MNRPEPVPMERFEKTAGWVYFPIYLLLLSVLLVSIFAMLGADVESGETQLHMNFIYGAINFLIVGLIFRRYLRKSAQKVREMPGRFFTAVAVGFAIYCGGTLAMEYFTEWLSPGIENVNDAALGAMSDFGNAELAVYTVLLAPLAEECLFRGLFFGTIRRRFWAYFVSILVFSAVHVMGYLSMYPAYTLFLCFLQYLPASFGLAWALEFSGSIWADIGVHTLANATAMALVLFGK